jgi:hypothetical protein
VEHRFGFNKITPALWLADMAKGLVLGLALGLPLLWVVLWLMQAGGAWWWLWAWGGGGASPSARALIIFRAASLAFSILAPAMDPEVSITRATSTFGRMRGAPSETSIQTPKAVSVVPGATKSWAMAAPTWATAVCVGPFGRVATRIPVSVAGPSAKGTTALGPCADVPPAVCEGSAVTAGRGDAPAHAAICDARINADSVRTWDQGRMLMTDLGKLGPCGR